MEESSKSNFDTNNAKYLNRDFINTKSTKPNIDFQKMLSQIKLPVI